MAASAWLAILELRSDRQNTKIANIEMLEHAAVCSDTILAQAAISELIAYFKLTRNREKLDLTEQAQEFLWERVTNIEKEKRPSTSGVYTSVKVDKLTAKGLEEVFEKEPSVRSVHIARKHLASCSGSYHFVLVVTFRWAFTDSSFYDRVCRRINFGNSTWHIVGGLGYWTLRRRIKRIPKSLIYRRRT